MLHAALRPGHVVEIAGEKIFSHSLSPSPKVDLLSLLSCPVRGASRGDPEVGQSESWPEGQPEGRCGARGCVSQTQTRGALGNRPCPIRGAAFSGWTGVGEGRGNLPGSASWSRACCRKLRSQGRRSRCDGASERRFCYYQGALFGAPSPLKKGRSTKSSNSRGGAGTRSRGCLNL